MRETLICLDHFVYFFSFFLSMSLHYFSLFYIHHITIDTLEMKHKRWVVVVVAASCSTYVFRFFFRFLTSSRHCSPNEHKYKEASRWYYWGLWFSLLLFINDDKNSYISTIVVDLCTFICVTECRKVSEQPHTNALNDFFCPFLCNLC